MLKVKNIQFTLQPFFQFFNIPIKNIFLLCQLLLEFIVGLISVNTRPNIINYVCMLAAVRSTLLQVCSRNIFSYVYFIIIQGALTKNMIDLCKGNYHWTNIKCINFPPAFQKNPSAGKAGKYEFELPVQGTRNMMKELVTTP